MEVMSSEKRIWHEQHRDFVRDHFEQTCQSCMDLVPAVSCGAVHHTTYRHEGGIYSADPIDLIRLGKITYLCDDCHRYEHETQSIDGVTKILPPESEKYLNEKYRCRCCGETCQELDREKRCLVCQATHQQTMSEYIF